MNIPKIWERERREVQGKSGILQLSAWGWSIDDRGEAKRRATEKLERMANRIREGLELPPGYAYGERPLREEIVRDLGGDGEVAAVVTRNGYGCLVLNTERVLFVDVDLPASRRQSWFGKLFARKSAVEDETLERIRAGLRDASGSSFRVYRTAGGFRLLGTGRTYEPGSTDSEEVMTAVGADPAFVQLCRAQKSFRARLTPKPWRCGAEKPPNRYPRQSEEEQRRFSAWLADYEAKSRTSATCRLVEEVGSGRVCDEARLILALHDEAARVGAALSLA